MRRRLFLGCGIAALALTGTSAWPAESKARARALIIANSYHNAVGDLFLANTLSDGVLIEQRLKDLQFLSVDRIEEANEATLKDRLSAFRASLKQGELALIYIAGHGIQLDDENFLLLGDGQTFISILSIIESVRQVTPSIILMLDACRNQPFQTMPEGMRIARAVAKKGIRALDGVELKVANLGASESATVSRVKAFQIRGTGVKVVFATDPQNVALDGADETKRNSPFAIAMSERLAERRSLDDVVALATGDVVSATRGEQSPWSQGSIGQPIFLAGPPEKKNPARPPFQVPG